MTLDVIYCKSPLGIKQAQIPTCPEMNRFLWRIENTKNVCSAYMQVVYLGTFTCSLHCDVSRTLPYFFPKKTEVLVLTIKMSLFTFLYTLHLIS